MDPTRDTAWAGALGATRTLPRTPTVGIAVVRADMTKAILQLSVVERCCECPGATTSDSALLGWGDVAGEFIQTSSGRAGQPTES